MVVTKELFSNANIAWQETSFWKHNLGNSQKLNKSKKTGLYIWHILLQVQCDFLFFYQCSSALLSTTSLTVKCKCQQQPNFCIFSCIVYIRLFTRHSTPNTEEEVTKYEKREWRGKRKSAPELEVKLFYLLDPIRVACYRFMVTASYFFLDKG